MSSFATNLERVRRLLAELKALYDQLPQEHRDMVCEQFRYCAQNCVAASENASV